MERSAPVVLAERITDLLALLLLAMVGVFSFDIDPWMLIVGGGLLLAIIAVIGVAPFGYWALGLLGRIRYLKAVQEKLHTMYTSTRALFAPATMLGATLVSLGSWFLECLAFWIIVQGFEGAEVDLLAATTIYAIMTVAGALTFLPGGLGVTEAGMLKMLTSMATGVTKGSAFAATFLTRVATLWFAVALGLVALPIFTRQQARQQRDRQKGQREG